MDYCLGEPDGSATIVTGVPDVDVDGDGSVDGIGLDFDGDGRLDDVMADSGRRRHRGAARCSIR